MSGPPVELNDEQINAIRDIFMLFDQDGNETITIKELGMSMRALGQHPTEEELKAIIAEIDADGNGIIEFDEFVDLMSRRPWGRLGSHEELTDAFKVFDHDGTGFINAAEFRHMMTTMGEKLTDEQLDEMMKEVEADGEGKVSFKHYVDCILD